MTPELMEQSKQTRLKYLDALKDWVANGDDSPYAYDEAAARAHMHATDPAILEAHANFRLGQHLIGRGRAAEGEAFVARAKDLHPDSWAMFRQAAQKLDDGPMAGIAAGPDFQERLSARAAAGKPYYAPIDIEGIPS